jgi:predicted O-methyltransferase YrrM
MWTTEAKAVLQEYLERKEREDKLWEELETEELIARRDEMLLPVGEAVGRLLHDLVVAAGSQCIVELGTSYGFSTLFLANAASKTGGTVFTFDMEDYKQEYARERLERAGLAGCVEWKTGDALELLKTFEHSIDFVLLDIWKDVYIPCFDLFYPRLADRALVAADNMLFPESVMEAGREYQAAVLSRPDMQSALLPVGSGIELSSRWPEYARQQA